MNVARVDSTHGAYFLQACTIILIGCLMSEKYLQMFSPHLALNFHSGAPDGGHNFGYSYCIFVFSIVFTHGVGVGGGWVSGRWQ